MPLNKPLLIFDGDCGFCRVWIARWKRATGNTVDYAPSQEVASQFPEIPPQDFEQSVQLLEPDGKRSSGALAALRALSFGGHGAGLWAYEHIPGFNGLAEFFYGVVAGNRSAFSWCTRLFWGVSVEPESYRRTRWVFLRALALVYAIAFGSLGVQIKGLMGAQGILPAADLLNHLTQFGKARFWYVPSLAWLASSDMALVGMCAAGILFSVLLLLNIAPRLSLLGLWIFYLSLVSVGGSFMSFQWDALLLEVGFLAIFFAPGGLLPQWKGAESPGRAAHFLLKWILFRLMLESSIVKWMSGDALWRNLTALTVHYQTQPLPNPLSWYAHHFPLKIQQLSCIGMFLIEGLGALLVFAPRRFRTVGCAALVLLQILIALTGNYTFFNLLAITLCLLLLSDEQLRPWTPDFYEERQPVTAPARPGQVRRALKAMGVVLVMVLTLPSLLATMGIQLPRPLYAPSSWVSPLRSFNGYGLFAVMTPTRPEIILEGSTDGKTWLSYEFKYKPGILSQQPKQVAPHQPRLDWQMWFAALGDIRQNPWVMSLCARLLQGSPSVIGLFAYNPFPVDPPQWVRASLYDYRFSTPDERKRTGEWWQRTFLRAYGPVLSLKPQ